MFQENQYLEFKHKVFTYMQNYLPNEIIFHTLSNNKRLIKTLNILLEPYSFTQEEELILRTSVTGLNVGYAIDFNMPLQASSQFCAKLLSELHVSTEVIEEVEQLITGLIDNTPPQDTMHQLMYDTYWSFIGQKGFAKKNMLRRNEIEHITEVTFSDFVWNKKTLQLIKEIRFYTKVAQEKMNARKHKNLVKQLQLVKEAERKTRRKKTGKDFGRGIDTVFRSTLRNHIHLSSIADGKANMIININTLLLSILITAGSASYSIPSFSIKADFKYLVPVIVLMIFSLGAIILAILSASPKISSNPFSKKAVVEHQSSFLFFGNFLKMPKNQFVEYLRSLKGNQTILYDDLAKDLYNLGVVLKYKYRLLKYAYHTFAAGLIISFLSFFLMLLG